MVFRRLSVVWLACLSASVVACKTNKTTPTGTASSTLSLSVPTGSNRTLAKGGQSDLLVTAYHTAADGTQTPLTGTVSFTVDNERGGVAPTSIALAPASETEAQASVIFTMCPSGVNCVGGERAIVHATLTTASGEVLTDQTAFNIEADPDLSCDKTNPGVCSDAKCANAECVSDVGVGRCNATSKACVIPPPNNGTVQLELSFEYPVDSPSAGRTPTIVALPKGSDRFVVKAKLTKIGTDTTLDVSKLKVQFSSTAASGGLIPGSFPDPANPTADPTLPANRVSTTVITPKELVAVTDFYPSAVPASGQIVVQVVDEAGTAIPKLVDTRPVNVVEPGSLVFTPASTDAYFRTLGVHGSGYQEQSTLRFALLDSAGNRWRPSLGAVTVTFSLTSSVGDIQVSPLLAKVDDKGEVVTTVYAGASVGNTVVKATTSIGSANLSATSEVLVVVGAKAASKNFGVSCNKFALNALAGNDCSRMRTNLDVVCSAVLADRFNNPLGRRIRVSWATEAGIIGLPTSTPIADPDNPTGPLGITQNLIHTSNAPMPVDVAPATDPHTGNPLEPHTLGDGTDACATGGAPREYNPRDGLVTFIAYTQGEEWFEDSNSNGKWDPGEAFDDLGEPFVDSNDDDTYSPGEEFIDTNGNGVWDPANKQWDADAIIWTVGHVVFTGEPKARSINSPDTNLADMNKDSTATINVRWEDLNGNAPAPSSTKYAASLLSGDGKVAQISSDVYPDGFASMNIKTLRVKDSATNTYSYKTNITYDTAPQQMVKYVSPASTTGSQAGADGGIPATALNFSATVGFTAAMTDVGGGVITASQDVTGSEAVCTSVLDPTQVTSGADADCKQAACNNKGCTTGDGKPGTCQGKVCDASQVGSKDYVMELQFVNSITLNPAPQRLTANSAPLFVTAKLTKRLDGTPADGVKVTFDTSNNIGLISAAGGPSGVTNIQLTTGLDGLARVTFTPGSLPAKGNLTVNFDNTDVRRLFDIVVPGTLQFTPKVDDNFYRLMGVATSGWREQTVVRFTLVDSTGQPYLGDAEVFFNVSPLGGVRLVPDRLKTDGNGEVVTLLYTGVQAGTVAVTATTTINGQTFTVQSSTIAVVGAKANARNFSIRCDVLSLPALLKNDCTFTQSDFVTPCTAVIGDRFNNTLGRDTRVTWLPEAGLFGPPSSTPLANPDMEPGAQPLLGRTINTLRTLNAPLPMDVDPDETILQGETTRGQTLSGTCPRQANPRDGLVTLIASTEGEEGFIDANNNGNWDPGEKFYDLGEPYVDANDNGRYDKGELYIDVDHSGTYTQANGQWDANTTIWAMSHVAYTGTPIATFDFPTNPSARLTPPFVDYDNSFGFTIDWRDENGNEPAPAFTTYSLGLMPGNGDVIATMNSSRIDQLGSIQTRQPTVCGYNPLAPDACKLVTTMSVSNRLLGGSYSAPSVRRLPVRPLGDEIIASVAIPDGANHVVGQSYSVIVPRARIPVLSILSPSGGQSGAEFSVYGSNLNGAGYSIFFEDIAGTFFSLDPIEFPSSGQIRVRVPPAVANGIAKVWVSNDAGQSVKANFIVGALPSITSFSPTTGYPGQTRVTLNGTGFDVTGLKIFVGSTQIEPPLVSGQPSPVFYRNPTQIRLLMPAGISSGFITVQTDTGRVTTNQPFSLPLPTISTDFSAMGPVNPGDLVTVTGTEFALGGLLVDVGGFIVPNSDISSLTNTSFQFVVPADATTGPVTVQTNAGSVVSATPLTVQ